MAGYSNAAQDLYGIGVRVGLYLQALGLTLYNYNDKKSYGKGLKITSGSISIAILSSWFVFATKEAFSPCEAFIVLLMLVGLFFPANTTLVNVETVIGETVGLVAILLADLGICAALLWTFGRLVVTLPSLETKNVVLFFAKVSLKGWFRWFALAYCIIDAATTLSFAWTVVQLIKISWDCRRKDITEVDDELKKRITKIVGWEDISKWLWVLHWIVWIMVVTMVEVTIQWNYLEPATDLQSPGQLIPLTAGIVIFIDSVLATKPELVANRALGAYKSTIKIFQYIPFPSINRRKNGTSNSSGLGWQQGSATA